MKNSFSILIALLTIACHSGQQENKPQEPIAKQGEYTLTEAHYKTYLALRQEEEGAHFNIQQRLLAKSALKEAFLKDAENVIEQLELMATGLASDIEEDNQYSPEPDSIVKESDYGGRGLAQGHRLIREKLGNDIGQMNFNSAQANQFRNYMGNSLLTSRSNSHDGSGGFTDSNTKIQFCANGSYIEANYAHISISVEGGDAYDANTDYTPGYWDVASLPNGMFIILLYSTHPLMLENSPNGFLPFPVAKYTANFVSLPNGDGYQRIANQPCN